MVRIAHKVARTSGKNLTNSQGCSVRCENASLSRPFQGDRDKKVALMGPPRHVGPKLHLLLLPGPGEGGLSSGQP
jgi:hypothetical protein